MSTEEQGVPASPPTIQQVLSPDGVYQINGMLIGRVDLLDNSQAAAIAAARDEAQPDGLAFWESIRWRVNKESEYNPGTVIELYAALIAATWGGFLLLPYDSFAALGKLWMPVRTMGDSAPGMWWYDNIEYFVGAWLFMVGVVHLVSVLRRRAGDRVRRVSGSLLVSTWGLLTFLFFNADHTANNWVGMGVTTGCIFVGVRAAFVKAGARS